MHLTTLASVATTLEPASSPSTSATAPSPPSPPQAHPALQLQNPVSSVALEFEQFHKMTTIMEVT